jgi:arsenate reductase (glutaredoxin)
VLLDHYIPPNKAELQALMKAAGMNPRELMRVKEAIYSEPGLDDAKWTNDEIVDFMLQHPILINRPLVIAPLGTRLCRPSELILKIFQTRSRVLLRRKMVSR